MSDMKQAHKIRRAIIILVLFILITTILIFRGDLQGWYNRTFCTPEILKEQSFIHLNTCDDPNKERRTFFHTYIEGEGFYGLSQTWTTIEGDSVEFYIYTHNGEAHGICDYTRDPYGSRTFKKFDIEKVRLMHRNEDGTIEEFSLYENLNTRLLLEVSFVASEVVRI
jgi:hypothetical protein